MERFFDRLGVLGLSLIGMGTIATRFIFVVDGGERVVIFNRLRGLQEKVYGEGMHFKIPIIMDPRYFEIRSRPRLISSTTGTKDLQQVDLTLRILFRPEEKQLPTILNNIGPDYDDKVLPSIGNEVLKAIVAQYNASELITMREHVSAGIREQLQNRGKEFGLILDDVSITHLQFAREFQQSIEQKQVAQQEAERAKYLVLKREEETKAVVIRAEADAEAAKLVSDAIGKYGPGLVAMRKIEAAQFMVEKMAANPNINFVHGGNTVNMLNLNQAGR